ncbi:hypothetical protein D3C77_522400 [compost metagenome]
MKAIGANSGTDNLQGIGIGLKHLALIINNHNGIEVRVLGLQTHGLGPKGDRIVPMRRHDVGAVFQAALCCCQELTDAGSHFARIGAIGLECRVDQSVTLDSISNDQPVGECRQDRQEDNEEH